MPFQFAFDKPECVDRSSDTLWPVYKLDWPLYAWRAFRVSLASPERDGGSTPVANPQRSSLAGGVAQLGAPSAGQQPSSTKPHRKRAGQGCHFRAGLGGKSSDPGAILLEM